MSLKEHLLSRGVDPDRTPVVIDEKRGIATFLIWNLSGQLVGYQQYNPMGDKKLHSLDFSQKDKMKYYTYAGEEGDPSFKKGKKRLLAWGMETVGLDTGFVFVAEGVFDAVKIHNAGFPALAMISNDPHPLRPFFYALNKIVIAILDRGSAGRRLKKFADYAFTTPEPYSDLGEMPQEQVDIFLRSPDIMSATRTSTR